MRAVSILPCRSAEVVKHFDDLVATEIRSVTQRRSPVLVANAGVFVQEVGVFGDEVANGFEIVVPDGVD
jgi:hypothetical protein